MHSSGMQREPSPSSSPYLCQRFHSLVWSCLDSDLTKSAVFYAERYFSMDKDLHDARHLYATALLRAGQPYSALHLVNNAQDDRCSGCLEIKSKCCSGLGRHSQAREALEEALMDPTYSPTPSMTPRLARPFPEEASLRCRSGIMALKSNFPEKASLSFRQALAINPLVWEAFEGLCALGSIPEIDEIFPVRPAPIRRIPPDESLPPLKVAPTVTGAGFFTPDNGNAGNLFRGWKPDPSQPFRMDVIGQQRPIIKDSYRPENTTAHTNHRPGRSRATASSLPHSSMSRPLSSADEAGPVPKKLRSTVRQRGADATKPSKSTKATMEEPLKKARARPALTFTNFFSSGQPATSSRANAVAGRNNAPTANSNAATRRSTRLLSGPGNKPQKHPTSRDRRRQVAHARSRSIESDIDEDVFPEGVAYSPSPPSNAQSPRSEVSPAPSNWTTAHEQAAQEEYDLEVADHYLYNLTRRFASATRALAMYDSRKCIDEVEKLPMIHQQSAWVLAMVGRAHYERLEYAPAERAFKACRGKEPYRLWDMEIYSTLLWHLQRNVELSFLAQELLNIDPQSPQAWIAVGNLFSLEKERSQALACFRRAAQMDPTCAYAFTLSGHESIDEDLDRAINFFQSALRADPRHYNAWYGLGTCYLRMSKVRLAEYHYRKASIIHPNNAVLLGCVGMAVERRGDQEAALHLFHEAVRISPDNALVRYRRAIILIAMKRYKPAIEDLESLHNSSPEESNVVFQLAKAYRLVGDEVNSARMLAIARDMSPKSLSKIKKLLETVKDGDGIDEQMDEG